MPPFAVSAPLGGAFSQGEKRGAGHPQPVRGNPHRRGHGRHGPTALRLVSPCDTDSEKRAVSASRGSGEGIEGCANGAMLLVSLQREIKK